MKKLVSSILLLAMMFTMLTFGAVNVSANSYADGTLPDEWFIGISWGPNTPDWTAKQFWMTDDEAYSGTSSVMIKACDLGSNSGLTLRNNSISGAPAGDYVATMYIKGTSQPQIIAVMEYVGGGDVKQDFKWVAKEDMGNGWVKAVVNITAANAVSQFYLQLYDGAANDYYIDNVSVCAAGSTQNLLLNGDFEPAKESTIAAGTLPSEFNPAKSASAAYAVSDVFSVVNNIAYTGNNSLKINSIGTPSNQQWYLRPVIEASSTGGTYTLSLKVKGNPYGKLGAKFEAFGSGSASGSKDIKWIQPHTNLGGGWYEYAWTFTSSSHITVIDFMVYESSAEYYIDDLSLTKDGTEYIINSSFESLPKENSFAANTLPQDWAYSANNATTTQADNAVCLTDAVSYEGNNSIVVRQQSLSNVQFYLRNYLTKPAGAGDYVLSFCAKGMDYPRLNIVADTSPEAKANIQYAASNAKVTVTSAGKGWKKYAMSFTANAAISQCYLEIFDAPSAFYIDNVELIKAGDTENLIVNPSFEDVKKENSYPANTLPNSWYTSHTNASATQLNDAYRATDETAYSGEHSVKVRKQTLSNVSLYLRNRAEAPVPAGEYTMSVYVKGIDNPHLKLIANGPDAVADLQYANVETRNIVKESVGAGWTKYSHTFTSEVEISYIYCQLYNAQNDFFIDKVELVKAGSTENLVVNGDFEEVTIPDYTASSVVLDTADGYMFVSNVKNNLLESFNPVMAVAAYDGDGALITVKTIDDTYAMGEGGELKISFDDLAMDLPDDWTGITCVGFVWDMASFAPLASASGNLFDF